MSGNISSLGIGSGVLTADIIDQLKAADEAATVRPLDNKITFNKQKQEAQSLISSLMKSFKSSASALSDGLIFTNQNVDITGTLGATVTKGATVESFSLETLTLAKRDITKLGAVADKTSSIASAAGVLKINDYEIPYTATTTLEELAQAITDIAGGTVSASILKTGEGAFNLLISSKETGADQVLTITDTDGGGGAGFLSAALFDPYDVVTNPGGYAKTQDASDATFKYNGITTSRSSNNIDDLVYGLNLTLKKEGDLSNVNISNDHTTILDEMQLFADSYNTLMSNLKDTTTTDQEKGTQGVFMDNTFIRSISRDLTRAITAANVDGDSIANYGMSIDETGKMSFNRTVLEDKLRENSDAVKLFFTGGTNSKGIEVTGIFSAVDEKVNSYTGSGKMFSTFETSLRTEATSLAKNKTAAQSSLDARYATMVKRFAAYDSLISKINSQFSSLKMMIDSDANSKS